MLLRSPDAGTLCVYRLGYLDVGVDEKRRTEVCSMMADLKTATSEDSTAWDGLISWVQKHGGHVDRRLVLRSVATANERSSSYRGVFATAPIPQGTLLISLPGNLSIDGQSMPSEYYNVGEKRAVSCWLRTLAAFLKAKAVASWSPYLRSLPKSYETLWCWSESELEVLKGVPSPTGPISSSTTTSWKIDREELRERFQQSIRPYFQSVGLSEVDFDSFAEVCQIISTRGFHDMVFSNHEAGKDAAGSSYPGPFLLPAIDLLNHGEERNVATSLNRNSNGDFSMVSERCIDSEEELLHSYGPRLTSCQFLATFGFVPATHSINSTSRSLLLGDRLAPLSVELALSKEKDITQACSSIIADRKAMDELASTVRHRHPQAELWEVPSPGPPIPHEAIHGVGDDVIVMDPNDLSGESELPDELVTALCTPFLPHCALEELTSNTLLDASILEDPFLRVLVGKALVRLAERKMLSYGQVRIAGVGETSSLLENDDCGYEMELLSILLRKCSLSAQHERYKYALTVRLQEKRVFMMLQRLGEQLLGDEQFCCSSRQRKRRRMKSTEELD